MESPREVLDIFYASLKLQYELIKFYNEKQMPFIVIEILKKIEEIEDEQE